MMTPEIWEKVNEIFHHASELNENDRDAYLKEACNGDDALRSEVMSLLDAASDAGDFISRPIVGPFVSEFAEHLKTLSPGNEISHYRIERAIGSGGMGEVYLAVDTVLNRKVALKTLPPSYAADPSFLRRFRIEAQALAKLNHPNVATVFSVEEADGIPFITLEYLEGQTLDRVTPAGGFELADFLRYLEPIADALSHAHEKGIIHRDIKPGNIMISADDTPKILDFGLAQFERSLVGAGQSRTDITAPGQIIGTPSYMSPEQAEGEELDQRSDIFSFGTVMYEALAGKRPFRGASQGLIIREVIYSEPEPLMSVNPEVPEVIANMIGKCLQKRPDDRFESISEVRTILRGLRQASDAGVSMDSFARRFYREAVSPPRGWLIPAAVMMLILALGGWYFFSKAGLKPPFSFANMTMRRLSQTNNVAYAAIAPDGKSIVYVSREDNGDRALWLRRVNDANAIKIVEPQPVQYWDCPFFSEDSEYVYFITASRASTHGTLYRVPALGGQPRKLVDKANHLGNLSPDGKRMLFVRYGDIDPNLSVNTSVTSILSANAFDGGDEQIILTVRGETILKEPRFSADGKSIFFIKRELVEDVESWAVLTAATDGSGEREIIRQTERISAIALLPNSNGLLMNAFDPVSNLQQIYNVSLIDGKTTRITNDLNFYVGVSIDREGQNIVAAQRSEENRLWVGQTNDLSTIKPVFRETAAHQTVDWTPNGRIVYDALENNRVHIWIADVDGKNALRLTGLGSDDSEPKVSPDGRYIVFTSKREGFNQIWRMNIDGSEQTLLANVPGITQKPRFDSDGKFVIFRWFGESNDPLGRVPVTGGPVEGLAGIPRSIVYFWEMSPDGKFVAYTTADESTAHTRVIVKPIGTNEPTATYDIWPYRIFKWTPDGRSLCFQDVQRGDNPQTKAFLMDPIGGRPKLLLSTEPDELYDLSFSRDQKHIALVRGKTATDAVILTAAPDSGH